jgi:transposase
MRQIREVFRLKHEHGFNFRQIALSVGLGRTAVGEYMRRAEAANLTWPLPEGLDDGALERLLYPPTISTDKPRTLPDFQTIHQEMKRKAMTLQLLWCEYRQGNPDGYGYSRVCDLYQDWKKTLDVVMRQDHKAGEKMFVDYSGMKAEVVDRFTGEIHEAEVFVATLGASNYTYMEATWTQGLRDWINSHVRAFDYFQGVPLMVVPDNLKTGVTKAHRYEPWLNETYQGLAAHYGFALMPARVRKPRDKAKVEKGVQDVERRVLAALRNRKFFSLEELNQAIWEMLEIHNSKSFQVKDGSRKSVFEEVDKPALRALPTERYEYSEWRKARVNLDYHVEMDKHYYSVPYTLLHEQVDVRMTEKVVEVFHEGKRVASHVRSRLTWKSTSVVDHMPPHHKAQAEWTPERLEEWAGKSGPSVREVAKRIMASRPIPQQGFRSCLGLMRLGEKYGTARLEAACQRALRLTNPNYKNIEAILKSGLDRELLKVESVLPPLVHENVRGAAYYHTLN